MSRSDELRNTEKECVVNRSQLSVSQIFEEQAQERPHAIAAVYGAERITYGDLNRRANQMARLLRARGVRQEVGVGICLERSVDLIVSMLAVLKAGGMYVPLDPTFPMSRLAFMLEDSGAPILVTTERLADELPGTWAQPLCLDTESESIATQGGENLSCVSTPENAAYVIYTSGSTGKPKGVTIRHRGITRLVLDTNYIAVRPEDVIGQASNASFDAITFEIWGALLNGAQIAGIPLEVALSPADLAAFIRANAVNVLFITTALFNRVAMHDPSAFSPLRHLMFGGESADPRWTLEILRYPPAALFNVYGPTENTTFSTWHPVHGVDERGTSLPIGKAIAYTHTYVLDRNLRKVRQGEIGELFVGGEGLARDYRNHPALTAEHFVPDAFSGTPGARLYRTGDMVRELSDGSLEFFGRIDQQVKIRGFRVELQEVEEALRRHPAMAEVTVLLRYDPPSPKRLVAYVIPRSGHTPQTSDLREFLAQELPDYMIPSAFVMLTQFPLNPNGKIDRGRLPVPSESRPKLRTDYAAPSTENERVLADIWEEVLRLDRVGVNDNFFDLGGDSLLMIGVHTKIRDRFGVELSIVAMFEYPTIRLLAGQLGNPTVDESALKNVQDRARRQAEAFARQRQARTDRNSA